MMEYPILFGAVVLFAVWMIGAGIERFQEAAKIAAGLATIALAVQSLLWLLG